MKIQVEGVETPGQLDLLRQLGRDSAQGFLFSRPMPADQIDLRAGSGLIVAP